MMADIMATEERDAVEISVDAFAHALKLNIAYEGDGNPMSLTTVNVNRPGLLLAGYDEYFGNNRIQVVGYAEMSYLDTMELSVRKAKLDKLFSMNIPCLVMCRGLEPSTEILECARKYGKPIFISEYVTSNCVNDLITYLNDLLAPTSRIHGVLLDVHGVGILLAGNSGMGKSETALELIKRGHRLVADDSVIVRNVRNNIIGTSPEYIRYLLEIRGIGIVNVKDMYGVGAVLREKQIELVIKLEKWDDKKNYDRIGDDQLYTDILGAEIPEIHMPVIAGRNLAIIVEAAARNYRLKQSGYNPVKDIESRKI